MAPGEGGGVHEHIVPSSSEDSHDLDTLHLTLRGLGDDWTKLEAALKGVTQDESAEVILARLLEKARAALIAENAQFALILGSPKEQAILTFNSKGLVTGMSHESERLLGISPQAFMGKPIDSILAAKASGVEQSADEMQRAESGSTVESHRAHTRIDGEDFLAHHTIVALIGPSGDNTGFVRTIRDLKWTRIHEIKVAELEQTIAFLVRD